MVFVQPGQTSGCLEAGIPVISHTAVQGQCESFPFAERLVIGTEKGEASAQLRRVDRNRIADTLVIEPACLDDLSRIQPPVQEQFHEGELLGISEPETRITVMRELRPQIDVSRGDLNGIVDVKRGDDPRPGRRDRAAGVLKAKRPVVFFDDHIKERRPVEDPLSLSDRILDTQIAGLRHILFLVQLETEHHGIVILLILQQEPFADGEIVIAREGGIIGVRRIVLAVESVAGGLGGRICPGRTQLQSPILSQRLHISQFQFGIEAV